MWGSGGGRRPRCSVSAISARSRSERSRSWKRPALSRARATRPARMVTKWTSPSSKRRPAHLIVLDHVDRADVPELGDDDPDDRLQRLVQGAAELGDPGDLVEHAE